MRIGNYRIEFYNVRKHRPVFFDDLNIDNLSARGARLRFADGDFTSILMMITSRLENVVYGFEVEMLAAKRLAEFVKDNALRLIRELVEEGFVRLDVSGVLSCGVRFADDNSEEKFVVEYFDDVYRATGETRFEKLRPHLKMLDTVNNSGLNLIENYGAMGILSPANSTFQDGYLDEEQKKEMQKEYNDAHGVTFGKWALMITRREVKFQPINLPIKELEIRENRKDAIGSILQAMNVPKELHALFESAKFANMNEAERAMYGNTVGYWAGVFCRIMRDCYERIRRTSDVAYPVNDFYYDFVGVPALQEAQYTEQLRLREQLSFLMQAKVQAPELTEYIDKRISDLIENI